MQNSENRQHLNIEDYKHAPMFAALIDLNEKMKQEQLPKVDLNIVGGFALMIHGCRPSEGVTDIDYIGNDLTSRVSQISEEIGQQYHFEKDWINNQFVFPGNLEQIEFATGKLHFHEAFDLDCIRINICDTKDLLRLKVIAVDSDLMSVDVGYDAARDGKDYRDIKLLLDKCNMTMENVKTEFADYIVNDRTPDYIQCYLDAPSDKEGMTRIRQMMKKDQYEALKEEFDPTPKTENLKAFSIMDAMLDNAIKRSKEENISGKGNIGKDADIR